MTTTESMLARIARGEPRADPREAAERCELCGETIAPDHRHLLDVQSRRLLCSCRACTILFDRSGAGGGHFRLVPERARSVADFDLDDVAWASLAIPVGMAFFFHSSAAGRVVAFYPSPLGATESLLHLETWDDLVARNPILRVLEPDVEALLVNRTNGAREHWLAPVDRCYELVGVIRTHWKGFRGGEDAWREIDAFFARLRAEAGRVTKGGEKLP